MHRLVAILSITVLCAAQLFLGGCDTADQQDQEPQSLRFWHFWSEPGQRVALQERVKEFERATGVTVELTELSWNDGKAKLLAAFNAGTAPDVVELGSDWVAQFSSAGVLMPLPADSTAIARFVPYAIEPGRWNGRMYAYPWVVDTRVMFVNRGLLDAAGWKGPVTTLDQLLEASEMVLASGAYGYGANGADAHRLYKKILPLMWTYGVQGSAADTTGWQGAVVDRQGQPILNSAANRRALAMYASLARTGFMETQRQLDAAFLQGKIAFWNSGSWLLPKIKETPQLRAEAILMPGVNGQPGISFAGGEYLAVNAATPARQRARELVEFLTRGDQALQFCKTVPAAGFPADTSTYQSKDLLSDPMKAVFAQQLRYARMTPVHPQWLDLESILEDATVRVLLGTSSVEAALASAQEDAEAIVRSTKKQAKN